MARLGLDLSGTEEMGDFSPLPEGDYLVKMIESERTPMKSGNGDMFKMKVEVIDGEHKGRTLNDFCNLWHNDSQVSEIAKKQLASIISAITGRKDTPISDSTELHGVPYVVKLALQEPNDEGKVYNRIKGYKNRAAATAPAPAHTQAAAAPEQTAEPTERPAWARQG